MYWNADGIETTCAVMDGMETGWTGTVGTDFKFSGTDGDGDKCSSPCSSLVCRIRFLVSTLKDRWSF